MAAIDGKTIVVLGGGLGGLLAAKKLRGKLGREHRVVLVEREIRQTFAPSYPWLMLRWRDPASISKDLASMRRKGIELMPAEVQGIAVANNVVETDGKQLPYDYLVVALGADLAPDVVPGFREAAHGFYDLAGAMRLREALGSFTGGTVAVVVASLPFKCPAAPYEGALLMDYAFRKRGIR